MRGRFLPTDYPHLFKAEAVSLAKAYRKRELRLRPWRPIEQRQNTEYHDLLDRYLNRVMRTAVTFSTKFPPRGKA